MARITIRIYMLTNNLKHNLEILLKTSDIYKLKTNALIQQEIPANLGTKVALVDLAMGDGVTLTYTFTMGKINST